MNWKWDVVMKEFCGTRYEMKAVQVISKEWLHKEWENGTEWVIEKESEEFPPEIEE